MLTLNRLKTDSLRIRAGRKGIDSEIEKTAYICGRFQKTYTVDSDILAFVDGKSVFVRPYTGSAISILEKYGFKISSFEIPFMEKEHSSEWDNLQQIVSAEEKAEFAIKCEKWCDDHDIGIIPDEILAKTFVMPDDGVIVTTRYYETNYLPIIGPFRKKAECDDAKKYLGTYYDANNQVMFVNRNGSTLVAKGYGIIPYLKNAGYQRIFFFIPFSKGEIIADPEIRKIWENTPVFE